MERAKGFEPSTPTLARSCWVYLALSHTILRCAILLIVLIIFDDSRLSGIRVYPVSPSKLLTKRLHSADAVVV